MRTEIEVRRALLNKSNRLKDLEADVVITKIRIEALEWMCETDE